MSITIAYCYHEPCWDCGCKKWKYSPIAISVDPSDIIVRCADCGKLLEGGRAEKVLIDSGKIDKKLNIIPMEQVLTMEMVKSRMDKTYDLLALFDEADFEGALEAVINECLRKKSSEPLIECLDPQIAICKEEGVDQNFDYLLHQLPYQLKIDKSFVEEFFEENKEEIRQLIWERDSCTEPIRSILKRMPHIPCQIVLFSNYDCINSHWFEEQGGYSYHESYFGHMIDTLSLNPCKVEEELARRGIHYVNVFPDLPERNGHELVSYEDFLEELENSGSPANLLTFMSTLNLVELFEADFKPETVTLPKENNCGLFSSSQGGGSLMDMLLLKEVTFDLTKTGVDCFSLFIDSQYNYSIQEVYQSDHEMFGKPLTLQKHAS